MSESISPELKARIEQQLNAHPVVLFMKGTAQMPRCGFSAKALNILNACGAQFTTVDILEDEELRQGLKIYSDWPTYPQLYIDGKLVGGCDIMAEMLDSGELQELINK